VIHCDVLVVGLGVMGSAVAHHAARRGARVIGVDQFTVPHDRGSSHGETRNFRQAVYENPAYFPLLDRAYELWRELEREVGRELMRITGRIMCGWPDGRIISGAMASARQNDLPIEVIAAAEVTRRWPVLFPTEEMVGVYESKAGVLFAEHCVAAQLDLARRWGAELRFDEELLEWRPSGRGVLARTTKEAIFANRLVLSAGGWMTRLAPELPLTIERQVLVWFEPKLDTAELSMDRLPIYLWELSADLCVYGIPHWGDGIKVARHHGGELCTMDTVRREVDETDVAEVRAPFECHMPALPGRFIRGKVCIYTNTPDQHFVIDRSAKHDAVFLVSPCSGHGFKFAPAIGEAVAELALDGRARQDLSMFRATRWPATAS